MATTPTLNTTTFSDFVRLAPLIWENEIESLKSEAKASGLFKNSVWESNTGNTKEYSEFDTNEYADDKDEGDQAEQSKVQIGYSKIGRLTRIGEDTGITWEMRNQGKYPEALRRIGDLAAKTAKRIELDLSHRLTFGTATTYTNKKGTSVDISVGDTLALFSTAHTLRGTSSTYRNRLANNPQISKGSLESMEKQIVENTLNQFGEKMTMDFDIIWTTDDPNTINTTRELLQATAEISSPNNGVPNVYQGKYRHVRLPRISTTAAGAVDSTKAKYWGIASSRGSSAHFAVLEEPTMREPSSIMEQRKLGNTNMEDPSTDTITYSGRACYAITIVGARWIHMSSGDGSA